MLVFNGIWRLYGPVVELRSPSHSYPLMKLSLEELWAQLPARSMLPKRASEDLTWRDLLDCCYTAGAVLPENWKELASCLQELDQKAKSPLEPKKPAEEKMKQLGIPGSSL